MLESFLKLHFNLLSHEMDTLQDFQVNCKHVTIPALATEPASGHSSTQTVTPLHPTPPSLNSILNQGMYLVDAKNFKVC